MYLFKTRLCLVLTFTIGAIYCYLHIVPERLDVYYAHPDHIENFTFKVKRYGRKSPYYLDGQGILKQTWNNNVTFFLDTYEYLHNEYRLSFVTTHARFCDLINKDNIFLGVIFRQGLVCPMNVGLVKLSNMSFYWENFPYEFPITKGLANVTLRSTAANELLLGIRVYVYVKQNRKKTS